jgi:DNA-directed RNA polymerase specialized sigma subunit
MNIKDAIKVSRAYQCRSEEESNKLYEYIAILVTQAQGSDNEEAKQALGSLIKLFEPKIYRLVKHIFPKVSDIAEFEDFVQECFCFFIHLVYVYDPTLSKFPRYIDKMLSLYIGSHAKSLRKKHRYHLDIAEMDIANPDYLNQDKAMNRMLTELYYREYVDFIKTYAKKSTKTGTLHAVCYRYFLGNETCTDIASSLGISYHAVYDYISKIKKELNYYIKHSALFDFYFSPNGKIVLKKDKEGRGI